MSAERLRHALDLLEGDAPLPPATRAWLRDALRAWATGAPIEVAFGLDLASARRERDQLLRDHAPELEAPTLTARARTIAEQARRLHRGRRTAIEWIRRADRLARLPETSRQVLNILAGK